MTRIFENGKWVALNPRKKKTKAFPPAPVQGEAQSQVQGDVSWLAKVSGIQNAASLDVKRAIDGAPPMKVLYVAMTVPGAYQYAMQRAMMMLGSGGYCEIHWADLRRPSVEIEVAFKEYRPDLTFCHIQAPGVVTPETFRHATGLVFNWTGDVRTPLPQWYIDVGRVIACTLFSNQVDVDLSRASGVRADFLNVGIDESYYTPTGPVERSADIVFMGSNYHAAFPRSQERRTMVGALRKRYGSRFAVYGGNWTGAENITNKHQREAAIYRGCKIAISQNHFNYDRYSSARPLRAMGCGAYVISNHYPNIEKDFAPGVHLDTWSSIDELFHRIDTALADDEYRWAVARSGCELVHEKHTWNYRMRELLIIAGIIEE